MFQDGGPSLWELAAQAFSSTTKGYDMLAPKFEKTPFRTPDALLAPMVAQLGGPLSLDAALDICCGTGAALRALRPLCRDHVTGVDLSEGMLAQAREQAEAAPGSAQVRLYQQDAMDLQFVEEFDAATCCGAFGHILPPDQDRFMVGVKRALRPGGRFVFLSHPMPKVTDPAWWSARGFNAAMHVRNALYDPPFIMFYLTFTLERAREVILRHGFSLEERRVFAPPYDRFRVVIATKR